MTTSPALEQVARFGAWTAERFGLRFDDAQQAWLGGVLQQRAAARRLAVEAYLGRLESAPEAAELDALARELTVSETYFFRNAEQLRALREHIVPERLRGLGARRPLRILSAGCASGEEPYSIAMTLDDVLPAGELAIRALDLNPEMIRTARRARYPAWSLRDTPAPLRARWFRADGAWHALDEAARFAVDFEVCNLCAEDAGRWRAETFDVVFCRNVLMYLTPRSAAIVIDRLRRCLLPGGYLFLGYAESLRGVADDFQLRHTHETFYYQRAGEARPAPARAATPRAAALRADEAPAWFEVIGGAAARIRALTAAVEPGPGPASVVEAGRDDASLARAVDLLREERFGQALEALRGLPAEAAAVPATLLLHAVLLTHDGQLDEAEAACRRLLAVDGRNAGAHYVLALCREGAGDDAAAVDLDLAAVALDPAFAMPRLHLGLLARRSGDRAAARRELGLAQALLPREEASRLMLFGGGFDRGALLALCRAELEACEWPA